MLAYATVKPHAPETCRTGACHRAAPGHPVCMNDACPGRSENDGAGRIATRQTLRHATAEQYAALPLAHLPLDGVALMRVDMCDECAETSGAHEPFCAHPEPYLPACPVCGAGADQQCVKKDGITALGFTHADRPERVYERCTHAHRPDCLVFDGCPCTGGDQAPERPAHPATRVNGGAGPDTSRLLFDQAYAQAILAERGIHWWQVRRADSRLTRDNLPCLWAQYVPVDDAGHLTFDEHGHEALAEAVIVLTTQQG